MMTHAEYAELGGIEGTEVITWRIMRGAVSARVRCRHRNYYLPSKTGIATAIYENRAAPSTPIERQRLRARAEAQLAGLAIRLARRPEVDGGPGAVTGGSLGVRA